MDVLRRQRAHAELCGRSDNYIYRLSELKCTSRSSLPPTSVEYGLSSSAFSWKQGNILAVAGRNGEIVILDTKSSTNKEELLPHCSPNMADIADGRSTNSTEWSEIDMKLLTTSSDGTVRLWNLTDDFRLIKVNVFEAPPSHAVTACFKPQNSDIFASGSLDGTICIWDSRISNNFNPQQLIKKCHKHESCGILRNTCIATVVYRDDVRLISSSHHDPRIKIWDLRKTYSQTTSDPVPEYQLAPLESCVKKGYRDMVTDRNRFKLFASTNQSNYGRLYCYNISVLSSEKPEVVCTGQFSKLSLSPDDRYIACVSDYDISFFKTFSLYYYSSSSRISADSLSTGFSSISWCPEDHLKLVTTCPEYYAPWIWSMPLKTEENYASANEYKQDRVAVKCKHDKAVSSKSLKTGKKLDPNESIESRLSRSKPYYVTYNEFGGVEELGEVSTSSDQDETEPNKIKRLKK